MVGVGLYKRKQDHHVLRCLLTLFPSFVPACLLAFKTCPPGPGLVRRDLQTAATQHQKRSPNESVRDWWHGLSSERVASSAHLGFHLYICHTELSENSHSSLNLLFLHIINSLAGNFSPFAWGNQLIMKGSSDVTSNLTLYIKSLVANSRNLQGTRQFTYFSCMLNKNYNTDCKKTAVSLFICRLGYTISYNDFNHLKCASS